MWPWWNSWFHICTACEEEPKEKQGEGQEGLKKEEKKKEEAKEQAKEEVKKELADVKEEENEEGPRAPGVMHKCLLSQMLHRLHPKEQGNQKFQY